MQTIKYEMAGRVVAVTGAAIGIGQAIAGSFADAGADVYLLDIDETAGRNSAAGVGTFITTDVTSADSWQKSLGMIAEKHGRLDVLVNNAGGFGTQQTTETINPDEWRALLDLNLTSVFLGCQTAIPMLRKSSAGRIINLGSLAGQTAGYRTSPAYAAAKAGVHSFTRVLAHELAPDGITVNTVAPSAVLTERIIAVRNEEERQKTAETIPLGRYQTPRRIGSLGAVSGVG